MANLRPVQAIIQELAEKYNLPYEIIENLLIDWQGFLYKELLLKGDSSRIDDLLNSLF